MWRKDSEDLLASCFSRPSGSESGRFYNFSTVKVAYSFKMCLFQFSIFQKDSIDFLERHL